MIGDANGSNCPGTVRQDNAEILGQTGNIASIGKVDADTKLYGLESADVARTARKIVPPL